MPLILGSVINNAVQSGASFNIAEVQAINTNSKMNMQAAAGSFNIGNANLVLAPGGGNLLPCLTDPDAVELV